MKKANYLKFILKCIIKIIIIKYIIKSTLFYNIFISMQILNILYFYKKLGYKIKKSNFL